MALKENLVRFREAAKLTQKELADLAGWRLYRALKAAGEKHTKSVKAPWYSTH